MNNNKKQNKFEHAPSQPSAATKPTSPSRDVQAARPDQRNPAVFRRNTRKGKTGYSPRTLSQGKRANATTGSTPKAGRPDTKWISSSRNGGLGRSASSHNRKRLQQKVYDPLLGRHPIPVVKAPDLLEQIVEDTNFLLAIATVRKEPHQAPGCDHKSVVEVCEELLTSP